MNFFRKLCRYFSGSTETAILQRLATMETTIMSSIQDHANEQNKHFDAIEAALTGVTEDIATMNALIEQLQNNPGPISPQDQEVLNTLQTRGSDLAAKLKQLDEANPKPDAPPSEGQRAQPVQARRPNA